MKTTNPLFIVSLAVIFLSIGVDPVLAQPEMVQASDSDRRPGLWNLNR